MRKSVLFIGPWAPDQHGWWFVLWYLTPNSLYTTFRPTFTLISTHNYLPSLVPCIHWRNTLRLIYCVNLMWGYILIQLRYIWRRHAHFRSWQVNKGKSYMTSSLLCSCGNTNITTSVDILFHWYATRYPRPYKCVTTTTESRPLEPESN